MATAACLGATLWRPRTTTCWCRGSRGDKYSLGYFGYAYYVENQDKLKVVPIDGRVWLHRADGRSDQQRDVCPAEPAAVHLRACGRCSGAAHLAEFVRYYLGENGQRLAASVGYIPYPQEVYDLGLAKFNAGTTGTVFGGDSAYKGSGCQGPGRRHHDDGPERQDDPGGRLLIFVGRHSD